jgi:hypothetical protein
VLLLRTAAWPQTVQFLPEIDTYVSLNPNTRFAFQAQENEGERYLDASRDRPKYGILFETFEESHT